MFQKPTFGSSATSSFGSFNAGASTSSPFSGFKPASGAGAFGAAPAFGAAAQPATGGGLFGSSNTSGGLFGAAAPAPAAAFGGSGFGFGAGAASAAPSGGLFGSTTGGGLFGGTQNTSAFGAKPPGFGFGTPTASTSSGGLFGSTAGAGGGLFGQQTNTMASGGLFSNTTGAFGSVGGQASGTAHVKYNPVVGSDVVVKAGTSQNINVKHHCITCMKEYEHKSLEELRLEDYQCGRKGAAAPMFGGFAAQPEAKPLFPSAFGQPAATTASSVFGAGTLGTNTGFGQTNTFSFGGATQPATNTGGLFGANKPTFGAPTTGTGLFGATTTQAPSFGTNTSSAFGFGATTQAQSGGLFAAKPATSGFGSTPASFGGFGGGLFQTKPAAPAFGTAQPAFGNLSTGFGTNTSTSGGLFNTSSTFGKPATSAPAFGFNTQPTLGAGLGTGLGANQAKPAVGFGTLGSSSLFQPQQQNNMFRTDGLGTGLFGGNTSLGAPALGMGLGGNTSLNNSGLTGASPNNAHEQMLTLCARPYGDSPLYKDLLPATDAGEQAVRPTNPAAVKALVERNRPPPPRPALRLQPRPLPADKKSLFDGLEESDASLEDKLSLKPSRKRLVLRQSQAQRVESQTDSDAGHESEERPRTNGTPDVPDAPDRPPSAAPTNADISADKTNSWLSSSKLPWNDKEKSIDNEPTPRLYPNLDKEGMALSSPIERRASWLTTKSLRKPLVSSTDSAENSVRELGVRSPDRHSVDKENIESLSGEVGRLKFCGHRGGEVCYGCEKVAHQIAGVYVSEEENVPPRDMPPHPAGVKLTRPGYYTIPSLDQMIGYLRPDGTCVLPHLTIGRHNYGNVFYDCEVDVAGLDLDALVHFLNKEVIVYPEDSVKPAVGEGLNRRAVVTLDRVWPRDKTLKAPITDCDRLMKMDYEGKLRRVCDKHDTKFIEYRPQTGSWVFRVEHFSKYGLTDSDEEEEAPTPEVMKRQLINQSLQAAAPVNAAPPKVPVGLGGMGPEDTLSAMHQTSLNLLNGAGKAFEMDTTEDNVESPSLYQENRAFGVKSPTSELARLENRQSHHVQLMKASLYADAEMEDEMSVCSGDQLVPVPMVRAEPPRRSPALAPPPGDDDHTPSAVTDPAVEAPMPPLIVQPHTVVLQYHRKVPPFKQTLAGAVDAAYLADMSVCRARHARAGFGPGGGLAFPTTTQALAGLPRKAELCDLDKYVTGRSDDDWSEPVVARIALGGHIQAAYRHQMQDLIEYSSLEGGSDTSCGKLTVRDRKRLLQAFLSYEEPGGEQSKWGLTAAYCQQVWRLCDALWGADLDNDGVASTDMASVVDHYRRLLAWLTEAVASITDEELAQSTTGEAEDEEDGHSRRVWTLMVGGRLVEACRVAREQGDTNMAALLAQAAGCDTFRGLLLRQLSQWKECGADGLMASHRLEALRLAAGLGRPDGGPGPGLLRLDWLRAAHVVARYLCAQVPTLERVVRTYETFFRRGDEGVDVEEDDQPPNFEADEMGMKPPLPPYADLYDISQNGQKHQVLDLRYELIRARATNTRPKLRPASYTPDPLDYSLCFLVGAWLGQPSAAVVVSAAAQLEGAGLWHLAVAALLFHPDSNQRDRLVRDVVNRHAPSEVGGEEEERLDLVRRLRVPETWIRLAQAHRAKYEHKPLCEAQHLVAAQQWNAAHRVLLDKLLPDAVLADEVTGIAPLLEALSEAAARNEVSGWCGAGMALHCWMLAKDQIRELSSSSERGGVSAGLEALLPQVAAAFRALAHWKPTSIRQWAAYAEMGGRVVHLAAAAGLRDSRLAAALAALRLPPAAVASALRQITTDIAEHASEQCAESSVSSPHSSLRALSLHT